RADIIPARRDLARRDAEPERGDGEVVSANAEKDGAGEEGEEKRGNTRHADAERQRLEIGKTGIALHDRAGITADAEEDDAAEGVVAHLAAEHVPTLRQHHHQPEEGELG